MTLPKEPEHKLCLLCVSLLLDPHTLVELQVIGQPNRFLSSERLTVQKRIEVICDAFWQNPSTSVILRMNQQPVSWWADVMAANASLCVFHAAAYAQSIGYDLRRTHGR